MVKHAALVSLGKHLGMFSERHIFEGSIEHVLTKMTPAERLARAEQLFIDAERFLPLLEQVEADLEAAQQDEAGEVSSPEG